MTKEEGKKYQLVLVLEADQGEKEAALLLSKIEKEIEKANGRVEKKDKWGQRRLAYPIKKKQEGLYYSWRVNLLAKEVNKFKERLRLEEGILRYLIIRS